MVEATKERLELLSIYKDHLCLTNKNSIYVVKGWELEEKEVKHWFSKNTKKTVFKKIFAYFSDNIKDNSVSFWNKDYQILMLLDDLKASRRRFQMVKDELKHFGYWVTKMSKNDG